MNVRCFYHRNLISLYHHPQEQFGIKFKHHLSSTKLLRTVGTFEVSAKRPIAVFSGGRGRPTQFFGNSVYSNQPDSGEWWK